MTDKTADLLNLCKERCIKPMLCICDACIGDGPFEEWTTEPLAPRFPPVVSADKMWSECRRDEWQMAPHPILLERGRDHG